MVFFDWILKRDKSDMHLLWDSNYSVGVADIDSQHKKLFALYNGLVDAMYNGESTDNIGKSLDSLLSYAITHFNSEEACLAKYEYPDLVKHKSEHKVLREKTYYLHKDYSEGKPVLTSELLDFLRQWISSHILGTDRKYSAFLAGKGD